MRLARPKPTSPKEDSAHGQVEKAGLLSIMRREDPKRPGFGKLARRAAIASLVGLGISASSLGGMLAHSEAAKPKVSPIIVRAMQQPLTAVPSPPSNVKGPWTLKFDDEFNGTSLDKTDWSYCYAWGACSGSGLGNDFRQWGYSVPWNCKETDGELNLWVTKGNREHKYFACIIQTQRHFDFTYGYVEARLWLPNAADSWPAFWLEYSDRIGKVPAEIDVMEDYGRNSKRQYYHYHFPVGHIERNLGSSTSVPGATSGWHTYAVDWEPNSIKWYYDGNLVWTENEHIYHHKMYMILNEVLDSFIPHPKVPAMLRVDYVRVWQHP